MKDQKFIFHGTYHEVAILTKDGRTNVIALSRTTNGSVVMGRTDTRAEPMITHSPQCCLNTAKRRFQNALETSVENGWSVAWRGFPYGKDFLQETR